MGKRFAIFAALAWIAGLAAFAAAAEDYPNRPIRVSPARVISSMPSKP